jgi:hypothetical protein
MSIMKYKNKCIICGNEFPTANKNKQVCNNFLCVNEMTLIKKFGSKEKIKDFPVCKICGIKSSALYAHLKLKHKISPKDYCEKYNLKIEDLATKDYRKFLSDKMSGDKNIVHIAQERHGVGSCSPFSKNFNKYKNLSDEEKEKEINKITTKSVNTCNENNNNDCKIEFYLARGMNEEQAKEALKERQTTFSLEKCIEKYGKEKGTERWKQRQEKWLKSYPRNSFSKISQELFWKVYDKIKDEIDPNDIYFATIDCGNLIENKNKEFVIKTKQTCRRLDFYIKSKNICIEFDGDYWHGPKRGNKELDYLREQEIKNTIKDIQIYHIKEQDYRNYPEKTVNKCLEIIKELSKV